MIFVSHANPEDNDFSRWLTLQLAKDGYGAWCDVTRLLGGENFWKDAEQAIRTRTVKFVYVLSRASNVKDGPRNELQIAKNVARQEPSLHDFIIPLHIDDLPHSEINVLLTSLNAIAFEASWARGYAQLLDVLERENVAKKPTFNPAAVSDWWRAQFSSGLGVKNELDTYLSNVLPITGMPLDVWFHTLAPNAIGRAVEPEHHLRWAGFMEGIDLITFAGADDIRDALGTSVSLARSTPIPTFDLLSGKTGIDSKKAHYFVSRLLRDGWERWIGTTGLSAYQLASKAQCYFFRKAEQPTLIRF